MSDKVKKFEVEVPSTEDDRELKAAILRSSPRAKIVSRVESVQPKNQPIEEDIMESGLLED